MAKSTVDLGLPKSPALPTPPINCIGCSISHLQSAAHKKSVQRSPTGHTLSADIAGPFPKTPTGIQYFLAVIEHHTRFKIVFLMNRKYEAERYLYETVQKFQNHFWHPVS